MSLNLLISVMMHIAWNRNRVEKWSPITRSATAFTNHGGRRIVWLILLYPLLLQMVLNLGSLQNSHEARISCLGLSSDGSALCTGSWDTNLKVSSRLNLWYMEVFSHYISYLIFNAFLLKQKKRQKNKYFHWFKY